MEWNTANILMFAVPRGRAIYFGNKVVPGDTKEVGGCFVKTKKAHSPRITQRFNHFFGHLRGGRQQKHGGVDRGYYGGILYSM